MKKRLKPTDIAKAEGQLITIEPADLMPLPAPLCGEEEPPFGKLSDEQKGRLETSADGFVAIGIPKPANKEEEQALVRKFCAGLEKLLSENDNWTFLQPLMLTLENCTKCQTCSEACPAYIASGRKEAYRPTFRAEILRRIIGKYIKNKASLGLSGKGRIEAQLDYRRQAGGACLPVHPVPEVRAGLSGGSGQRSRKPRDPKGFQPGDGYCAP